ncbi:MAG TPA: hypothetical protein VFB14_25845 [Bryobacteraceae bacterium]|nr:hypothetical protein [Bryobacteraceae bacterium]
MTRKIKFALIFVFLAVNLFAREEYTRTFDKTIPVSAGERISIEHQMGDIVIHTQSKPEVTIHADIRVSAPSADEAKSYADRIEIRIEPSSSLLAIRTRYPQTRNFFGMHNTSYYVRYDIGMPETCPLDIRNSFGAVSVAGIKANSDIVTSHGALDFRDGKGTQRLENSFAAIHVMNNAGDVTVEDTNASVDVAGITGALNLRNRFGNVKADRISKGVSITNSNGSVDLTNSGGIGTVRNAFGGVNVQTFHGDLTINDSNGKVQATGVDGQASLETTFGELRFADIKQQLSVHANNSRIQGERVGGPLTIQNSFGAVTVANVQQSVRVQSGNGEVSVANVHGPANLKTSFATVHATDVDGLLTVENQNGGVRAENARGAQVVTSFGPVILDGISGPIQIESQNGAVDVGAIAKANCQPIIIKTSFSTLRVRLQGEPSYRVSARTSFGKIRTDFPLSVSGSISTDSLSGTIGSGRCEMRLTDNNGNVEILRSGP